ncbi:MAG: hypothetical protein LBU97_04095 [Alistipes sp.]|jgi:hypothetical protein|nr:hypothetical protein [Alistipes sp.]
MPLTGLEKVSVRPRGGVASVELFPASQWGGEVPAAAAWTFREDRALYSEQREPHSAKTPVPLVRHTLVMEFPSTAAVRRRVGELAAASSASFGAGFVARVTLASGETIVVGHSARFGTLYPLRVAAVQTTSGRTPADLPAVALTLESTDADEAETLTP